MAWIDESLSEIISIATGGQVRRSTSAIFEIRAGGNSVTASDVIIDADTGEDPP
jgi:hypothetical protein